MKAERVSYRRVTISRRNFPGISGSGVLYTVNLVGMEMAKKYGFQTS